MIQINMRRKWLLSPTIRQFPHAPWRASQGSQVMDDDAKPRTKAQELRAFLLLSVVMAPVLAVGIVSGYGFLVWMFQLLAGPPGPKF